MNIIFYFPFLFAIINFIFLIFLSQFPGIINFLFPVFGFELFYSKLYVSGFSVLSFSIFNLYVSDLFPLI